MTSVIAGPIRASSRSTKTTVVASVVSVMLIDSDPKAIAGVIHNDSVAILHVRFGVGATLDDIPIGPGAVWPVPYPGYTGRIDGIWEEALGNAHITRLF